MHSQTGPRRGAALIAIVGPTGVGKTALSLRLAQDIGGEVVSADSRQIYRGMDIGTAKVAPEERAAVPHHLIDVVDPGEQFTLAQYQQAAYRAIDDILERVRVPLLVGGTGLYVRAVLEGLRIPEVPPNPELRAELYQRAEKEGKEALYRWLLEVDPRSAAGIDARNVRRVVRALEVYLETGCPPSDLQRAAPPPYHVLYIGLTMERKELYRRIDARVEHMVAAGLVDEVRGLLARGYDLSLASMSGVGYRQIVSHLHGEIDLEEAVRLIRRDTRRFVRQQFNWFRLDNPAIRWFDVTQGLNCVYQEIQGLVVQFLEGRMPL